MSDTFADQVRERAVAGIRWVMFVNVATIPLSFLINILLGHVSPEVLGYYGAVQIFKGSFETFFVFGGAYVFTRLVPRLDRQDRLSFLVSYTAGVVAVFLTVSAITLAVDRRLIDVVLERFGIPSPGVAFSLCLAITVWAFTLHFLYAVLRASGAAIANKLVVVGFALAAILGVTVLRSRLDADASAYLWTAGLVVYVASALTGIAFVTRTPEYRERDRIRWVLPREFWTVASYSHLETVIAFVYTSLAPSVVLLWIDVESLGFLHAALRYPALLALVPTMLASVIAPALSTLDAAGLRDRALAQAASAIRISLLVVVPAALALILFAGAAMAIIGPEFRQQRLLLQVVALGTIGGPVVSFGVGLAVAMGAFRTYLMASVVYVLSALALTLTLVPVFGLVGAAAAAASGAIIQQIAMVLLLRVRLGFPAPGRLFAGWACAVATLVATLWLEPGVVAASLMWALFVVVFAVLGRVTPAEVGSAARRLFRSR